MKKRAHTTMQCVLETAIFDFGGKTGRAYRLPEILKNGQGLDRQRRKRRWAFQGEGTTEIKLCEVFWGLGK